MILALSGKISSGKDTVGKIIQYLVAQSKKDWAMPYSLQEFLDGNDIYNRNYTKDYIESISIDSGYEIKKFADKLKDIVALLIGCTREQLEDRDFKEKELGEEWDKWQLTYSTKYDSCINYYSSELEAVQFLDKIVDSIYFSSISKIQLTPRLLLQLLGTECGRNIIHPNIWCLSTFEDYKINHIDKDFLDMNIEEAKILGLIE